MKKLNAIVFALMLLFSTAISAAALEYKTIYRQNGVSAYADWIKTSGDVNTYTSIGVTKSDAGTDIYASICTYDPVNYIYSCKSGYLNTKEDVFTMDNKLGSASLSAVDVTLYDWDTGSAETVSIQTDWTGTGEILKDSFKYSSKFEDYTFKSSSSSSYRGATATGSIDDNDLGASEFAGLVKFKSAQMEMKK